MASSLFLGFLFLFNITPAAMSFVSWNGTCSGLEFLSCEVYPQGYRYVKSFVHSCERTIEQVIKVYDSPFLEG
jgi:hypothetical protein